MWTCTIDSILENFRVEREGGIRFFRVDVSHTFNHFYSSDQGNTLAISTSGARMYVIFPLNGRNSLSSDLGTTPYLRPFPLWKSVSGWRALKSLAFNIQGPQLAIRSGAAGSEEES